MTKTKRIQILCLLGAVTLLLSGCWTEAPVESANGLLGDQEPADQQEEVILPAAFTLPYDPDQTLDPVTCADGMQQVAGSLIYEGLFRLDRQLEPQPWLCQSYTYDAASLTYTFTLRSGVTFSDGSPLTAADAAATLRRAKSSQRYSARLAHVAAVSAGDGVVIVTLSRPDSSLPALLESGRVKSEPRKASPLWAPAPTISPPMKRVPVWRPTAAGGGESPAPRSGSPSPPPGTGRPYCTSSPPTRCS